MTRVVPASNHPWRKGYMPTPNKSERTPYERVPFALFFGDDQLRAGLRYRAWRHGGVCYLSMQELAEIVELDRKAPERAPYVPGLLAYKRVHGKLRVRLIA